MRRVVIDTETTGLYHVGADRVIEIGCVELDGLQITGQEFQTYLSCNVKVQPDAYKVHGISDEFLDGQPEFPEVVDQFLEFIGDDELIAHNGIAFDIPFIQKELRLIERPPLRNKVFDTLVHARSTRPGKRNSLDAIVKDFKIKNTRDGGEHGAIKDCRLLAKVYCHMMQGRGNTEMELEIYKPVIEVLPCGPLVVVPPTPAEAEAHLKMMKELNLRPY